jgi:hypothetical protein
MAFKSTAKAEALIRDLKDKLELRIKGTPAGRVDSIREAKDAQGWPLLILSDNSNEAAGQPVIGLRLKGVDAVSKDVFGNSIIAAAPHILEIAWELDGSNKPIPNALDITKIAYEAIKLGTKVQIKQIANGTAVSEASMNAAAVAEEYGWLHWPTKEV